MGDKLNDKLDKILDKFDEKQRQQQQAQQAKVAREDVFLANFSQFRTITARPLFEQIGNHLRSRGHDFEIRERDYQVERDRRVIDANIALYIYPAGVKRGMHGDQQYPSYTLTASRSSETVRLHGSTMRPDSGGTAAARGEYALEHLSRDFIEEDLLRHLAEVFTR